MLRPAIVILIVLLALLVPQLRPSAAVAAVGQACLDMAVVDDLIDGDVLAAERAASMSDDDGTERGTALGEGFGRATSVLQPPARLSTSLGWPEADRRLHALPMRPLLPPPRMVAPV
ncbi:hypothetical protein [Caenispirillum bisanense]|uniref:hypothetical protein n=1 Tax=Caenispirillum bisanense TaxID=414052 RepID=UPI0031D3F7AC